MTLGRLGLVVALIFGVLVATVSVQAQQTGKVYRIGLLLPGAQPTTPDWKQRSPLFQPFFQGLRELGWVEEQNISTEFRWAEGKTERLPDLAAELVRLKVDLILTLSYPAALAAKQATTTIPVVIMGAGDPVGTGLVQSLARPGGNITGLSEQATELSAKRVELLKETVPTLSRLAVLWNAGDAGMTLRMGAIRVAARVLGVTVRPLGVQERNDLETAFVAMTQERPEALFVVSDIFVNIHRRRILDFAAKNRLPAMYEHGFYVDDGGLMSYGPSLVDTIKRSAFFVDKILKGAKPANIPVEQPTRYDFVLNLKTAKALGLSFPQAVLIRADKVIE
ncbi:MAG: ABC transporter substrate-binding protein [Candidatus Rokubacteria bacterium]|nr:ABC transporter substrate-binding protein [Candidatus Rokubacteria bacterium]